MSARVGEGVKIKQTHKNLEGGGSSKSGCPHLVQSLSI